MSSALERGRTLKPEAVAQARKQTQQRLKYLNDKISRDGILTFTRRELHEWRHLTGKMHP